jgi:hypothetical protein
VGLLKLPKRKERPQDDAQTLALLEKIKARRSDFTFIGRYKVVEISTGIEWCVAAVTAPKTERLSSESLGRENALSGELGGCLQRMGIDVDGIWTGCHRRYPSA